MNWIKGWIFMAPVCAPPDPGNGHVFRAWQQGERREFMSTFRVNAARLDSRTKLASRGKKLEAGALHQARGGTLPGAAEPHADHLA